MSTIKLDHIELLVGPSNYEAWKRGISQVLQGEGYWGHVEGDADIYSPFPIEPQPAVPTAMSSAEDIAAFREWWKSDSRARTIVERRITPVTLALLPHGVAVTARSVWETLKGLYSRKDVMSQLDLRDRTEYEMVHSIIRGLPSNGSWLHFQMLLTQINQDFVDSQAIAVVPAPHDTLLNRIISWLVLECQWIESSKPSKSGPGSEYCNHAGDPNSIRKHDKNPLGILCSNCGGKSHDRDHCFAKGGGMEGKGQASKPKGKAKTPELAAVSTSSSSSDRTASSSTTSAPVKDPSSTCNTYIGDLSCASIDHHPTAADFAGFFSA